MSENTVGEIFRKHYPDYLLKHRVSREQAEVARHIMICRTPQMGGRLRMCNLCGHVDFQYNSCKDRHCPQCGHFEKERWLLEQEKWLLPIPYYHAVFTISHELNPLVLWNRKQVYDFLMRTVGDLLKAYGQRYLGGEIGITQVLHTWGQTLQFHIHVHCIITGGALCQDDQQLSFWHPAHRNFLFPVKKLSADFRDRFCQGLQNLWDNHKLTLPVENPDIPSLLHKAQCQAWEVYIERPFCGVDKLLDYLGRYVFRIAIGNYRILALNHAQVSFSYQDNRDGGQTKTMTLPAEEFIHRFLQHVLPKGFVRIRHYGLHHSSCRSKLQKARSLFSLTAQLPQIPKLNLSSWLTQLASETADPDRCPVCGQGVLVTISEFGPTSSWRLWLGFLLTKLLWHFAPAH